MKNVDISQSVMHKVAVFERQKIRLWLAGFISAIGLIALGLGVSVWYAASQIMEQRSLELLSLFREDPEIIREFWQDTLDVFWEEFPKTALIVIVIAILLVIFMFILTQRNRIIIRKKLKQLDKMN